MNPIIACVMCRLREPLAEVAVTVCNQGISGHVGMAMHTVMVIVVLYNVYMMR